MGSSSQFDIVARLQLRAEQFSSESGRSFAEMATRAKTAANDVRASFGQSFAEVQRLAERSLQLPRTASGSLDLSSEIASLRQAATAADNTAVASRELGDALQRTAFSANGASEAILREADAAMVASRASEADAGAIRQRIAALEEVQRELNKNASATVKAANDNTIANANQRQSVMMLGQQVQDFSVQVMSGTSVTTAFSQQIGQAAFAVQGLGGKFEAVGAFLGSGWGAAVLVALTVLTPLVGKILDGNSALDNAIDKLRKDAEESRVAARAKEVFASSIDGVTVALRDQDDALRKTAEAERSSAERANIAAKAKREEALAIREATAARLADAVAQEQSLLTAARDQQRYGKGEAATYAAQLAGGRVTQLEGELAKATAAVSDAKRQLNVSRVDLAAEQAQTALDPVKAVTKEYDAQIKALKDQQREQARLGRDIGAASKQRLQDLEAEKKAAVAAAEAKAAAAKRLGSATENRQTGRPISSTDAAAIVRGIGGQVNSADRTYAQQAALYTAWIRAGKPANNPVAKPGTSAHEMGNGLDVQMGGGMSPAKLREAFEREGVRLTKVFAEKGHWHIEWAKSGTVAREVATSIRDAEREQKKLEDSLDSITAKYDPAAAAARKYREELQQIDALVSAGRITREQGLIYKVSGALDESARQTKESDERSLGILAPSIEAADTWFREQAERGRDAQREIVDTWFSAADSFRYAASSIADLVGVRVKGSARALLAPGGVEGQSAATAKALTDTLVRSGIKIDPASITKLTSDLGTVIGNASYGQLGGSVFSSITGGKGSKGGSAIGGILGGEAGKAVGGVIAKEVGGALGKSLGAAAGPLGAIAGGVIGSVVGGLFKKKSPSGSVDITGTDASATTASGKLGGALTGNASAVQKSLTQIAEQLGAVTGAFSVSIGKSGDWYHVAGSAGADVSAKHPKSPLIYEGKDETAAVQAAILNALQDGAIKGISDAAQRILKSGQDLDLALRKALLIEAVPRDLKAMLDPVGAAIDELNRKFQKTVDALKEGGASAEEMAQAERLYNLQLQQTKASTTSASQALKDFLTGLKLGSSSPYSLRDQEATARAQLQPYLSQIDAGQAIDQSKYQSAANAWLDIERQLYGSTQAYFDALDTVQAATNKAISSIDNAAPITTAVESPFAKATAASAATTASNTQTGNELLSQLSEQLGSLQAAVEALGAGGYPAGDFIGSGRLFASAA